MRATGKAGRSIIPFSFWVLSAISIVFGIWYGILLNSTVLVASTSFGVVVLAYNVWKGYSHNKNNKIIPQKPKMYQKK